MDSARAAYGISEACDRVMDSKLKPTLCKEIVTPLIDSLAFLVLVSSELNQFRKDYLKSRLPEKIKSFAKNGRAKSEWLFGDDFNKRINTISSTNTALTASIRPCYQYDKHQRSKTGSSQQHDGSKSSHTSRRGSTQRTRWPTKHRNRFHRP